MTSETTSPAAALASLPAGDAITILAALGSEEFSEVIKAALSPRPDGGLWDVLTDRRVLPSTVAALKAMNINIEGQLAMRRSDMDVLQADCFANGPAGRADWFAAKREYDDWRRRAIGYRRLVVERLGFVTARQKAIGAEVYAPNPVKAKARGHNMDVLYLLARAVAVHKAAVTGGEGGPEDDERLWGALSSLTVATARDEMPLGKWVAYVEAARAEDHDSETERADA